MNARAFHAATIARQRAEANPPAALVVIDLADPRVLAVLRRDDSAGTKAAALGVIGDPVEHSHNEPGVRWYTGVGEVVA